MAECRRDPSGHRQTCTNLSMKLPARNMTHSIDDSQTVYVYIHIGIGDVLHVSILIFESNSLNSSSTATFQIVQRDRSNEVQYFT